MVRQRTRTPPDVELVRLLHRRNELDRAIQLLEEIRLIRLKRAPELSALVSKVHRRVA